MAQIKEKVASNLTPAVIIALLIIAFLAFLAWTAMYTMTTYSPPEDYHAVASRFFVPFIYIIILMEVLGRYSKKLRLNPTQYLLLLIPLWMAAGKAYITDGTFGETPYQFLAETSTFWIGAVAAPGAANWVPAFNLLPSFVIPHTVSAALIEWNGLKAGQTIPWGTFIGPIIFWSLFVIALGFMNVGFSFTVTGPEWTEVERLVFPLMVPPIYLINTTTTRDANGHSALLSLKTSNMKVFWISAVIGLLVGGVPIMLGFLPSFESLHAALWGEIPFTWGSYIAGILPGAYISPDFIILQAVLMILLPYEVMVTALVTWLAIPMFYDTLAVKMGWVTYVAGSENTMVYGNESPFPYSLWAQTGLAVGLGLYFAWRMRGRISKVLKTLTGPTYYEGDFSVKTGAWVLVGSTLLFFVLMLAMGVNWLIGIVWLILYFLYAIYNTRVYAEIWWHPAIMANTFWQLYWPIGAGLGIWGNVPAQNNASLMAIDTVNTSAGIWWGVRSMSLLSPAYSMGLFKVAHDVKASIKDVFGATMILTVIMIPVSAIFLVYWYAHVGMVNTYLGGALWNPGTVLGDGITGLSNSWYTGDSFGAVWGWTIGGIILIFFLMWLRGLFPWFMFNPTAFVVTLWLPEYMWLASLVALVSKYALSKSLGPRRTEEYVVPAATGFAVGYGALLLVAALIVLSTYVWPLTASLWKP